MVMRCTRPVKPTKEETTAPVSTSAASTMIHVFSQLPAEIAPISDNKAPLSA